MSKHPPVHSICPESGVGQTSIWSPMGPAPRSPCSPVGCACSQHPHVGTKVNHPPESSSWEEPVPPADGVDRLGTWQSASLGRVGALAWSKTSLLVYLPRLPGAVYHVGLAWSPPRAWAIHGGSQRQKKSMGGYPARAPKSLPRQLSYVLQQLPLSPPKAEYEPLCKGRQ